MRVITRLQVLGTSIHAEDHLLSLLHCVTQRSAGVSNLPSSVRGTAFCLSLCAGNPLEVLPGSCHLLHGTSVQNDFRVFAHNNGACRENASVCKLRKTPCAVKNFTWLVKCTCAKTQKSNMVVSRHNIKHFTHPLTLTHTHTCKKTMYMSVCRGTHTYKKHIDRQKDTKIHVHT